MQIGRSHFHKSHAFDYRGDVPVCVEEGQSGNGEWAGYLLLELKLHETCLHATIIDSGQSLYILNMTFKTYS